MKTLAAALLATTLLAGPALAAEAPVRADQVAFRALYKELVETNTTLSAGNCTLAAERMAARLKAAGMADAQLTLFSTPEHPKEGGLVAILPGSDRKARPILLMGHLDVVEAKREDWVRDPFTLIEEGGYFYARGAYDDKAMAAIWVDTLARIAASKARIKRTLKLALTCGEETSGAFNGAEWLVKNRPELLDAAFAINEVGGGTTNGKPLVQGGALVAQEIQMGEKAYQDFTLTVTNPGGHSSMPVADNAIVTLGRALEKVHAYRFPLQFNDTTRAFLARSGAERHDETGKAMVAVAANPDDAAAADLLGRSRQLNAQIRTTCVPTMVTAGHALNALPQRATANVNCRMFPGNTTAQTQAGLVAAIGDATVTVAPRVLGKPIAKVPPFDPAVTGPMEKLAAKHFPGVPVIPSMLAGATDGVYLGLIGIPAYGPPGLWKDTDNNGVHGLNERIEVLSLMKGRDYLYDLVRVFVD